MTQAKTPRRGGGKLALVYNPGATRSLAVKTTNPAKRRRRRRNPQAVATNPKRFVKASSHRRRNPSLKSNPSSLTGLIGAGAVIGMTASIFDALVSRYGATQSAMIKTGVKFGVAYAFHSSLGNKIPILAKYKNELALVFVVAGMVDLFNAFVMPGLTNAVNGLVTKATNLIPVSNSTAATTTTNTSEANNATMSGLRNRMPWQRTTA